MRKEQKHVSKTANPKTRSVENSESIPADLIFEIFSRLSLSRFRCVSKEWASIFYQDLSHLVVDNHMPIPTRMGSFLIHRPVGGLICGQFKKLPAARTRRVHVRTYLGHDPIKKEYKLLCMSLSRTYPKISEEHQVLTLGTGKLFWRMIECSLQRCPESGGICINGVLYYSAYPDNLFGVVQNFIVICFDVTCEKLGAIQFDSVGFYSGRTTSLGLMVLDDAEQHKWSKETYILPPFWKNLGVDTRLNVVGMTGDSEIVFSPSILSDPFYIFYYDAERNTTVKVRVQGIDFVKNQYIYTFIDHAEDLKPM
ncbi:hypothetical protein BRARA_F02063 [Brassica rapa]|uniref:F-box associated beta-propeller type 3 domain-containing protein n=1 Tax=Brassica campestris TaxID=3711 RepID=A0A397Z9B4_BRACM|nr:hypothetical protein BRARA_F02063 [Brassica rapa]